MRIVLTIILAFSVGQLAAQVKSKALATPTPDQGQSYYGKTTEPPRAIQFHDKTVTASAFITNIHQYLKVPAQFTFASIESTTDQLGMRHHLLQQYYKGIPLEGMTYRVHEKDGYTTSANGKAVREITLNTQIILAENQAFELAKKYLNTTDTTTRKGTLLIVSKGFSFAPESFSIAYQFEIDVSLIERWRISIDARDGQVLNQVSLVNTCFDKTEPEPKPLPYGTGTGLTRYYGSQTIRVEKYDGGASRLVGETQHGGKIGTYDYHHGHILSLAFGFPVEVYDFYSSTNSYTTEYQRAGVSVQWAAEQAYEYYFTKFNRNSFNNAGAAITSYVHVHTDLDNAFWTGKLLAFGDGSNNNPLVELDVVGHELTHGVTQYEAGLQYYYESGALNESFSDIFGKAIAFNAFGDTASWQLARHYRDGGLRDMSNPNLKEQPDTYAGDLWYTGYEDSGGVHTNSGVQNFWFYLLCEGGSGVNDHDFNYTINAIGIDKATSIAYRSLTEYLNQTSDYLDSRIASLLATADLYGKNSIEYQEVDKAWDAVGVVDEPIITNLELYDITATTVKIKGSLLPRGDTVSYHFEYGTTPAFGTSSAVYEYKGTVEGIITGLQAQTKYYVRLVATNENGNSYAATEFTTISLAPLVNIQHTVDAGETTATLYGAINPNSLETSFYFEYGLTEALGLVTQTYPLSDTTEFVNVSAPVANLLPRKNYYYRLVATNSFSAATSESASFFTAAKPVIISFLPATGPVGAEVVITGQNFNVTPENNVVSFGATSASVVSATATQIKVKVPQGASLSTLSLLDTESGLIAESVKEFVPTYTGEFTVNSMNQTVGLNENLWQVIVHDMDGDQKPDLVGRHNTGFSVFVNVNQGGDVTEESFVRNTFNGNYSPGPLSLVDFDGNGLHDIVGRWQDGLRVYPNFSIPGFIFFGEPVDVPGTRSFQDLMFNDFDMDGHVDIAGTSYRSLDSTVFTFIRNQNPKGTLSADNFSNQQHVIIPLSPYFTTSGDLNNDGSIDVMISEHDDDKFVILTNNSHPGAFAFAIDSVSHLNRGRFARYTATDVNSDGWKDIIAHSPHVIGNLSLFENNRNAPKISVALPAINLNNVEQASIAPGDVDGDGRVDVVVGTGERKFLLLKNNVAAGQHLSASSFGVFKDYGMPVPTGANADALVSVNDLNGDGRPEIINLISYSYGPHDGYTFEIWQNGPVNCIDGTGVTVTVSSNTATIVLPENTTFDQFEIDYTVKNYQYWTRATSTTLELNIGYTYQLRARAKCYLNFSEYTYREFATDCVNISSFTMGYIGTTSATIQASNPYLFEVQYSGEGKNLWVPVPQGVIQISNLTPATTYDVRFRGRCGTIGQFQSTKFTTLCPPLTSLTISDLKYDRAMVNWTSTYAGKAQLEYSSDNINWILIDESKTIQQLLPTRKYYVRGKLICATNNSTFISTTFTTPCPKVKSVSVESITPFTANVTWVDESNSGKFELRYSRGGGAVTTVQTTKTSYALKDLTPGASYTVMVAPLCTLTKDFTTATFTSVCYSPFDLTALTVTQTTAELSWNDTFSALPYSFDYSISGSNRWVTANTSSRNASLSMLRPGTQYEVRVHISCPSVEAPFAFLQFETPLYAEATYAPNPTQNLITIYPSKDLIGNRFSILDNTGREMVNGTLADYTLDFSDFPPGMYILKIDEAQPMRVVKR